MGMQQQMMSGTMMIRSDPGFRRVDFKSGEALGNCDGMAVAVGEGVGSEVGPAVGEGVGSEVGSSVGEGVGSWVGTGVGEGVGGTHRSSTEMKPSAHVQQDERVSVVDCSLAKLTTIPHGHS